MGNHLQKENSAKELILAFRRLIWSINFPIMIIKEEVRMFMMPKKQIGYLILILALFLAGCTLPASQTGGTASPSPGTPGLPPQGDVIAGLAVVETIDIMILESFPVQVQAVARGNLPDGCTTLDETMVERAGNLFRVTLTTQRPADAVCTDALVPFDHVIPLDVLGLPAGEYQVDVNGITGSFTLQVDNILPGDQPPASETPQETSGQSSISGGVWHDLCAIAGGEGGEPAVPSAGCVQIEGGGFQANGVREDNEPGLEDIEVSLGQGACPGSGFRTVRTDGQGRYQFSELPAGTYCVSIQADSLVNGPILIPGGWTAPEPDKAEVQVTLTDQQALSGIDFGWDYQFLPEPEAVQDESACTNKVAFVEDMTFPDDTTVSGGQEFEKIWKLRNDGTCTWNTAYALVFSDGDQMGAASPQALPGVVTPGDEVEAKIKFTAPAKAGTYRSEWLIRSAMGAEFGIGRNASSPFWVQIQVVESTADLGLGEPTFTDSFNNANRWFLVDSGNTRFTVEDGSLVMKSFSPGSFDEWGISNYGVASDFFIETTFRTGDECSGLDRYGLLLRSPDPNEGYVFAFSCDGRYRLYAWDGTYTGLVEWTSNSNIKRGPEATNKMGVLMEGRTIKLYANGTLLVELENQKFDSGSFGIFVASGNTPNFTAYADDLSLWELED
jgi:hypothetical protein